MASPSAQSENLPLDYWQTLEDVRRHVYVLCQSLDLAVSRLNRYNPQENLEIWLLRDVRDPTVQLRQAYNEAPMVRVEKQVGCFVTVPGGTRRNREELAAKLNAYLAIMTRKACLRGLIRPKKKDVDGREEYTYTGPTLGPAYHGAVSAVVYCEAIRAYYQAVAVLKRAIQPRALSSTPVLRR